jgi:hypothetical protein
MLRSVQRLERRGGFPRLFETRRDYLQYQAIARIQGAEREPHEPHERWERLLRRAVHGPEQVPE